MSYTKEDFDKIIELLNTKKGRQLKVKHDKEYMTAIVGDKEYDADYLALIETDNYLDDEPTYLKKVYLEKDDDGIYQLYFDFKYMIYIGAKVSKTDRKGLSIKNILRLEENKATNDSFLKNLIVVLEEH